LTDTRQLTPTGDMVQARRAANSSAGPNLPPFRSDFSLQIVQRLPAIHCGRSQRNLLGWGSFLVRPASDTPCMTATSPCKKLPKRNKNRPAPDPESRLNDADGVQ